ncbi:MAG: sugar phosphate isomerase/epimerase family protein [Haloferacaceae archaeon]
MTVRERIGVDLAERFPVGEAVEWAADHDVHYVDVRLDDGPLDPDAYGPDERERIVDRCAAADVSLGLHTLSGVNVAEKSPHVSEGVDAYLRAYVDCAAALDADRVIVHGGYHFGDEAARTAASLDRLDRTLRYAADRDVTLLLENHNREPDDAEIHYLPVTLDQCERYFGELDAAHDDLGWACNPPHARLFPEGIDGYVDALGVDRCGQVRLNDNDGTVEEHLAPGEGTLDFAWLFDLLEGAGYDGHYMLAFGTPAEMLEGREYLAERHPGSGT